jgi:hypothetical protein
MNNDLKIILKEAASAKFKILSRHLPGGTDGKH